MKWAKINYHVRWLGSVSPAHGCRTTKQFLRGAQRPPIWQIDRKALQIKGLCVPKSNM